MFYKNATNSITYYFNVFRNFVSILQILLRLEDLLDQGPVLLAASIHHQALEVNRFFHPCYIIKQLPHCM